MKRLPLIVMLFLTEAVYLRPGILTGADSLMGSDYEMLHRWRLGLARDSLFGPTHTLPAWNPHELLGAPFWSNLQSFPWIPTRLFLLFFDPTQAYAIGVAIAAGLAALFTWLYARRAGFSETAAGAAGWTFACAGFFSSRVMAGHLPLLEAYPALPLLLWLIDRTLAPELDHKLRVNLVFLALASACIAAAGHPQVPAYAIGSALLYAIWRGRKAAPGLRPRAVAAMVAGIGITLAVWWPMLKLIGRSTRLLHLAAPDNDVTLPYSRLIAFIIPGIHGWAEPVAQAADNPFTGYPNNSWFWDTASYTGLLPLAAIAGLAIFCLVRKKKPDWRAKYFTFLGLGSLICSLPLADGLLHALPGTFLRSPARLLYLSSFAAAIAVAAAIDVIAAARRPAAHAAIAILLVLHFADLANFDRKFIQTSPRDTDPPAFQTALDKSPSGCRVAEAREDEILPYEARYDDAGGFDSIFLARFSKAYLALAGLPPDTNEQIFDASTLPPKALRALSVCHVITTAQRSDLELIDRSDDIGLYRVPDPEPRAQGAYARPSTDEIVVKTSAESPTDVSIVESFDDGWTATIDGASAPIHLANGFAMSVSVPSGPHEIRLKYRTPGRVAGACMSLLSGALLGALIASAPKQPGPSV